MISIANYSIACRKIFEVKLDPWSDCISLSHQNFGKKFIRVPTTTLADMFLNVMASENLDIAHIIENIYIDFLSPF